jgi:hypothetical protein
MSADIEEAIDKDERAMERVANALESIAESLAAWCILSQARFDRDYPAKREPRDITLTRIPSEEDKIKESQGATEETTDEWLDIGPRERELLATHKALARAEAGETKRASRRVTQAGSTRKA